MIPSLKTGAIRAAFIVIALLGLLVVLFGMTGSRSERLPAAVTAVSPMPESAHFVDHAATAGLTYTFSIAGARPMSILQTIGNGCAFLDFNQDANLDILLVGNSPVPRLFAGDGKGHFRDVSAAVGFLPHLPKVPGAAWLGCAVGDFNNDGYPDIYLSGYRAAALFQNVGGRRFVDVTQRMGIHPERWGTSCGFADLDGDGYLDLFVGNYVQFTTDPHQYQQQCNLGVLTGCGPMIYQPEWPTLYHNIKGHRFEDISAASGIRHGSGKNLGVAFADYDGSGRQSILVANDLMPGDLFHNDGHLHFSNRASYSGTALSLSGTPHGGMGVDWADYDGDGRMDAVVGTFENEPKSIYHNEGHGVFTDRTNRLGIGAPSMPWVTFGCKWIDYDGDGWPDLVLTNGHVYDNASHLHLGGTGLFRQPMQVFHNLGGQRFTDVSQQLGPDVQRPIVGRGLAVGDYDNDGRPDLLVIDSEGAPLLLHNEGGHPWHWLGLSLVGTGHSNRDALGAQVTVRAGKRRYVKEVQTAGSYLSASDKRLLFGLGTANSVQAVSIRWPDGHVEQRHPTQIDRYLTCVEKSNAP